MVPSVAAAWMEPGRGLDVWNRLRRLIDWLEENAVAVVGALLLFFVTSEVLYTVFLVHPESGNPAVEAISYWWGQHKMERVGGPMTFYLPRLLQYEFAILLPALAYIFARWKRLSFGERFVAGWALSSVAMYAYLGEKAVWLIVHQVPPRSRRGRRVGASRREAAGMRAARRRRRRFVVTSPSRSLRLSVLTPNPRRRRESTIRSDLSEVLARGRDPEPGRAGEVPAATSGEGGLALSWYVACARELAAADGRACTRRRRVRRE